MMFVVYFDNNLNIVNYIVYFKHELISCLFLNGFLTFYATQTLVWLSLSLIEITSSANISIVFRKFNVIEITAS